MPFSICCDSCGASFAIPDDVFERKVAGRVVSVRCKQCRKDIRVDGTKKLPSVVPGASNGTATSVRPRPSDGPNTQDGAEEPAVTQAKDASPSNSEKSPEAVRHEVAAGGEAPAPSPKTSAAGGGPRGTPTSAESAAANTAVISTESSAATDAHGDGDDAPETADSKQHSSAKSIGSSASPRTARNESSRRTKTASPKTAPQPKVWAVSFADNDDRELSESQIAKELQAGTITGRTIVWTQDMPDWKAIADVPDLARHVVVKVVPPPSREPAPPPRRQRSSPRAAPPPVAEPATPAPPTPTPLATRPVPKPIPPTSPAVPASASPFSPVSVPAAHDGAAVSAAPAAPFFPNLSPEAFDPTTAPGGLGSVGAPASPFLSPPALLNSPLASAQPAPMQGAPGAGPPSPQLDYDFSLGDAEALRKKPPLLWIGLGFGLIVLITIIALSVGGSDEETAVVPTSAQVPGQSTAKTPTSTASDSQRTDQSAEQSSPGRSGGSTLLEPPRPKDGRTEDGRSRRPRGKDDFADAFAKELGK